MFTHLRRRARLVVTSILATVVVASVLLSAGPGQATPPTFNLADMGNSMARGKITEPFNVRTPKAAGEEPWPPLANLKTKGPSDFYSVRLTLRPGVHTGWHKHQGFVLTTVEQGTVTEYDESCQSRTYSGQRGGPVSVGDGFVDRGRTHILKNEGTTDVVLALFTIIPPGAPPFDGSPVAPCAVPQL